MGRARATALIRNSILMRAFFMLIMKFEPCKQTPLIMITRMQIDVNTLY